VPATLPASLDPPKNAKSGTRPKTGSTRNKRLPAIAVFDSPSGQAFFRVHWREGGRLHMSRATSRRWARPGTLQDVEDVVEDADL
jgi:hypothetical protein